MIDIKTEELVKPLSDDSNLTPVYNRLKHAVDDIYYTSLGNSLYDDIVFKGKKNVAKDYFSKYDKDYKLIKLSKIDPELVKQYEGLRDGYLEYEKMIQSIFNCVEIGENQDTAIKKLAELTKTLTYFDMDKLQYNGYYFKPMTKKEILKEINRTSNNSLVLQGRDFNIFCVKFSNDGKVSEFNIS